MNKHIKIVNLAQIQNKRMDTTPFFTQDTIAFGILMLTLGFVFYTSSSENKGWKKFYKYFKRCGNILFNSLFKNF